LLLPSCMPFRGRPALPPVPAAAAPMLLLLLGPKPPPPPLLRDGPAKSAAEERVTHSVKAQRRGQRRKGATMGLTFYQPQKHAQSALELASPPCKSRTRRACRRDKGADYSKTVGRHRMTGVLCCRDRSRSRHCSVMDLPSAQQGRYLLLKAHRWWLLVTLGGITDWCPRLPMVGSLWPEPTGPL
jgi:hypothetical protein